MEEDKFKKAVGRRIKESREAKNLTQEELGGKLNVTRNTVTMWERGKSTPPVERMSNLVHILGVCFRWLVLGEEEYEPIILAETTKDDKVIHIPSDMFLPATLAVEDFLAEQNMEMDIDKKKETIVMLCEIELEKTARNPENVVDFSLYKSLLKTKFY